MTEGTETTATAPAPKRAKAATLRRRKSRKKAAAQRVAKPAPDYTRLPQEPPEDPAPTRRTLPDLDPLEAAREAQRHAQEGNLKLSRAIDIMREGLEVIVFAEQDRRTGLPVDGKTLRKLAAETLDAYSAMTGQNWRKVKLTGASRAGDRSLDEKAILDSLKDG